MTYNQLKYWSTRKLATLWKDLDYSIYTVECYSVGDLFLHNMVGAILDKRGVEL